MGLLHDLPLVLLVLIGFTLPLTLFPSFTSPFTSFLRTLLLAIWDFSKLFVLFVALLIGVLVSEHVYRWYLKRTGVPEPVDYQAATSHGIELETAEDVRTKKFEAFARQSGLHGVVKGIFRVVTGGPSRPGAAVTGHSTQTARGATPPPAAGTSRLKGKGKGVEEEGIELGPVTPRREGLRQRAARGESPTKR